MELENNLGGEVENENIETSEPDLETTDQNIDTNDKEDKENFEPIQEDQMVDQEDDQVLEYEILEESPDLVENTYNEYLEQIILQNDQLKTISENILNVGIVSLVMISLLVGVMCANIFAKYFRS